MIDESDEWFDDVSWNFNDTNDITISLTYYGQVDKLIHHCEFFSGMSDWLKNHITVQFINDASPDKGIFEDICHAYKHRFKLKSYTVKQDIGFNNHGCRNLAMLQSETHWNWLIDIDVFFNEELLQAMTSTHLENNQFYVFKVRFDHYDNPEDYELFDEKKLLKWVAHPNVWLINKPCFWSTGGYDMEFAGMRHGDKEFFQAIDKKKYEHFLFHPFLEEEYDIHVQMPNRTKSYLNQITEHVGYLQKCVDFVKKRNDNKERKHKKRLLCFDWQRNV